MTESDELVPAGRLRTMQIIAAALPLAVFIFLSIALCIVQFQRDGQGLGQVGGQPIVSLLALGTLAFMALVSLILPNTMVRQGLRRIAQRAFQAPSGLEASPTADVDMVMGLRQSTLIVSLALIEGPAFLGCIAYLLEGRVFVLGVVGLAIGLMLVRFPTQASVRAWMRQQLDWLEQGRPENDASNSI
jgi:hypothetical protein